MENEAGDQRLECRHSIDADGAQRLTLLGEVDIAVAHELKARLGALMRSGAAARLDLSELRFIDLCGLDAILSALRRARRTGYELEVDRPVSRTVERIIAYAGVGEMVWPTAATNGNQASANFQPFTSRWSISSQQSEP
jgi:anti-anti-sigma factor